MFNRPKVSTFRSDLASQTSYPAFVIRNSSLAGVDRVNKIFIPLHLYKTETTHKKVPQQTGAAQEVKIIPPLGVKEDQRGHGKDNPLEIMKHPIKVII